MNFILEGDRKYGFGFVKDRKKHVMFRKNIVKVVEQSSSTPSQVGHLIEGNGLAPLGIDVLATTTCKPAIKYGSECCSHDHDFCHISIGLKTPVPATRKACLGCCRPTS